MKHFPQAESQRQSPVLAFTQNVWLKIVLMMNWLRLCGKIWLQPLPFSRMADRIVAATRSGNGRDEGNILGKIFQSDE